MSATVDDRFHNDLVAVVESGVALEFGSNPLACSKRVTASDLKRLSQSHPQLGTPDSERYLAAKKVFNWTNSMAPVLDGLVAKSDSIHQVEKIVRWTFVYLVLVLVVSLIGIRQFLTYVFPELNSIRQDLLIAKRGVASGGLDFLPYLNTFSIILAVLLLVGIVLLLVGGPRWLGMLLGGKQFVLNRLSASASEITSQLLACSVDSAEAVDTVCCLVGGSPLIRTEIKTVHGDEDQLALVAEYFREAAENQLIRLKSNTPLVLVTVVGGIVTAIFCISVYGPIIVMLREVISTGLAP